MDGYIQKTYAGRTKRYVQTLDLRDDPEMIRVFQIVISFIHSLLELGKIQDLLTVILGSNILIDLRCIDKPFGYA